MFLNVLCNIEYSAHARKTGVLLLECVVSAPRSLPMKTAISRFTVPFSFSATLLAAVFMNSFSLSLAAQQPPSNGVDVQREAMRKLSFLTGHWSGAVTIFRGQGGPLHLSQTQG